MSEILRGAVLGLALVCLPALAGPMKGDSAPEFRLQDQNNEWHALEDYRGRWVVLFFYPKADTPGCTTEACEFRDNIFAFEDLGAVVMGVSLDDVASQEAFANKYSLPFPLLSDAKQSVAKSYGVLTSFRGMQVAARQTFLIDPRGNIAVHYDKVDPKSHSQQVLTDLNRLVAG